MPKIEKITITIVTQTGDRELLPMVAVNGCKMPLAKMSGSVGNGETFVGELTPYNAVYSLQLLSPSAGKWDIGSVQVVTTFADATATTENFGPVVLGESLKETPLWKSPNDTIPSGELTMEGEFLSPWTCRFLSNHMVHHGYSAYFNSHDVAKGSPLAEQLFAIENVMEVIVSRYAITVSITPGGDWEEIIPMTLAAIRTHLASGLPAIRPDFHQGMPGEKEIASQVSALLEMEINPYIASHGGIVRLLDVYENNIYLQMGGGCQGCASAHATLKFGVERLIRETFPKIGEILDQTDHAAGVNPYYPRN